MSIKDFFRMKHDYHKVYSVTGMASYIFGLLSYFATSGERPFDITKQSGAFYVLLACFFVFQIITVVCLKLEDRQEDK